MADNQGRTFRISPEDESVLDMYWGVKNAGKNWYVARSVRSGEGGKIVTQIFLHRYLLNPNTDQDVDHVNHVGTDNTRPNIRICTRQENLRNNRSLRGTSRHKGVYWAKSKYKWAARIVVNYKAIFLGYFDNEDEAAAYNRKAKQLFGRFKNLNVIP